MAREAWFSKDAIITMEQDGASSTSAIQGSVTSFEESGGDRSNDYIAVFGGGQITKENRQEAFEVKLEVIPTDLTFFEPFYGDASTETSTSVVTSVEQSAIDYRVTITWGDGFDAASPKVPNTGEAIRYTYVNANAIGVTPTEDADGELTATLTFSLAGQDSDANPQVYKESTINASSAPLLNPFGRDDTRVAFGSYT